MVLHLILRYLSLKIGGEVRKKNRKGVNRTTEVSPSLDRKIWSVIIVTKHGTFRENVFFGKRRTRIRKKEKHHDNDDHVTTAICDDDLIILCDHDSVNLVSDESMWIIDSGATLHVTPRKELFTSYTSGDFGMLKMGNDGVFKVIDICEVCLQTNMGMQLLLKRVKHAPDIRFNLISVQMLDDSGYENHFGSEKWKLSRGNLIVA